MKRLKSHAPIISLSWLGFDTTATIEADNAQMLFKALASGVFYGRFARAFSVLGYRHAAKRFSTTPFDLTGQRWLVTGASGGIGRAIALEANRLGAEVIAVARSPEKLATLKSQASHPDRLLLEVCDLSSLQAISDWIHAFQSGAPGRLDVLVNNVGVLLNAYTLTHEGMEQSLATNLLGPVLLTRLLLSQGSLTAQSLVINVSSGGMYGTPLDLEAMAAPDPDDFDGVKAYALHKRAQVTWTHHWNATHPDGPLMQVMHPGWVDTEGVRTSLPLFQKVMGSLLRSPAQGADTVLWLGATRPDAPKEGIWLDRALQPEHAFSMTKNPKVTAQDLVVYLDQALAGLI
ncbi:MAG TPA: SDR family NAD(P)-dependent oxidoreductase [Wenzhouxiangella sp.]